MATSSMLSLGNLSEQTQPKTGPDLPILGELGSRPTPPQPSSRTSSGYWNPTLSESIRDELGLLEPMLAAATSESPKSRKFPHLCGNLNVGDGWRWMLEAVALSPRDRNFLVAGAKGGAQSRPPPPPPLKMPWPFPQPKALKP